MLWRFPPGLQHDPPVTEAKAGKPPQETAAPAGWVALWRSFKKSPASYPYLIGFASGTWKNSSGVYGHHLAAERTGLPGVELVGGYGGTKNRWDWEGIRGPGDTDSPEPLPSVISISTAWGDLSNPDFVHLPGIYIALAILPDKLSNDRDSSKPGKPWRRPHLWQEVNAGTYDRDFRLLARRLAYNLVKVGRRPSLTLIDHFAECTGGWKPWSVGVDVAGFKDAYRRVTDIFREEFLRETGEVPVMAWRPAHLCDFGPNSMNLYDLLKSPPRLWEAFPGEDWVDATSFGLHNRTSRFRTYEDWSYHILERHGHAEGLIDYFDWVLANTRRTYFAWTEWGYLAETDSRGWPPIDNPTNAFKWTREAFDRYGERMVAALYSHAGQITTYRAFAEGFKAAWGQ